MADRISLEDQTAREGFFTGGYKERPAVHVALAARANRETFRQVAVGAEEEGVPCRLLEDTSDAVVALAYAAAQSSRFGVGIGIGPDQAVIHEVHMPAERPVLCLPISGDYRPVCRLAGTNAARLVIRLPLRLDIPTVTALPDTPTGPPVGLAERSDRGKTGADRDVALTPDQIKAAVHAVVRVLRQRGAI